MSKLTPSLEMYLETIYLLKQREGCVRVKDIAELMKVKAPSVHEALHHLTDSGHIRHEHYKPVGLTELGEKEAEKLFNKHKLLTKFFSDVLGVSQEIAEKDACIIEHYLSDETISKFMEFLNRADK